MLDPPQVKELLLKSSPTTHPGFMVNLEVSGLSDCIKVLRFELISLALVLLYLRYQSVDLIVDLFHLPQKIAD